MMDWGVGNGNGRVEHVERGEGESGELTDWEILTQRRRGAECAERFGRVEHVERVEGDGRFLTQRRREVWTCRTCRTCRGGWE